MNLYQYAGNNPASYTDPFGLMPCPPCDDVQVDPDNLTTGTPPLAAPGAAVAGTAARLGRVVVSGARGVRIAAQARTILSSSKLTTLREAAEAGRAAQVTIGGRPISFEPGLPASAMTNFAEGGFHLGRQAFSSQAELTKTVLQELYRLGTGAGVSSAGAAAETAAAAGFAERAYKFGSFLGIF
jgi:hypothetical protein